MDLKDTIRRCQLGEKEAFKELLQSVEKKALSTAYLISGNRGIAEDILQETYLKCFKEIGKLKEAEAFNTWFFKILVRTGWQMCKKQSEIIPVEISSENEGLFYYESKSSDNDIDRYELKDMVKTAIDNLSENLKTVVILYYFNDMSIGDIAKVTGCFQATIKSRLFYARSALKKQLGDCFENEDSLEKIKCEGA